MADHTCSVDDCGTRATRRGWCDKHYRRWLHHGSPLNPGRLPAPDPMSLLAKQEDGCWLWMGPRKVSGYGVLRSKRAGHGAHRVFYDLFVGPIPEGMEIDHLCRVPSCVNPDHLEAVTPEENRRRSLSPMGHMLRTNTCKRGHEMTPENSYSRPSHPTRHQCRTCMKLRNALRRKTPA